jgi:diguanylate cyclase (GGDEF)-like protein
MGELTIKVLLVEDNPDDARLFRGTLPEVPEPLLKLTHVERLRDALQLLICDTPDLILLDLSLPDSDGLETVRKVRDAAPGVPIVVLTGGNDETLALQAVQQGAQDCLVKGQIESSPVLRVMRHAIERHRMQVALHNLSLTDDLTGLHNRRGFLSLANQQLKMSHRSGKAFLVLYADLDDLKKINDTFGHMEGNRALVDAAGILRACFRQSDILARVGGDEFAALMADAPVNSIEAVRHRLQENVESYNAQPGRRYRLSFSVGTLSCGAVSPCPLEELLAQADALMYEQKRSKRILVRGLFSKSGT